MKRIVRKVTLKNLTGLKNRLLTWAQHEEVVFWLDSNAASDNFNKKYTSFQAVLALGEEDALQCGYRDAFYKLQGFRKRISDFCFGFLSYDLKNDIEELTSANFDGIHFPDLYFFRPKKLFFITEDQIELHYLETCAQDIDTDLAAILHQEPEVSHRQNRLEIKQRISKEKYLKKLESIKEHIHKGDIYEVNFCQEFYAEDAVIDPLHVYTALNRISEAPFANFVKLGDRFLLSASPERFVKKMGDKVISQPIKGTARRCNDPLKDRELAKKLYNDPKERSENIMIVDLVRNDLSKFARQGTVKVEELCGVYSFKQVHQLISTVSCLVDKTVDPEIIIKDLFPMGSMTGAPKISAMEIIENLEETRRGLYSGAVGYFTPDDDFDFNVVIRSILYNRKEKYVSFIVGGAITAQSDNEKEYEECLLKAGAMKRALKNPATP